MGNVKTVKANQSTKKSSIAKVTKAKKVLDLDVLVTSLALNVELYDYDALKAFRTKLTKTVIQNHTSYEEPKKKAIHLVSKENAIDLILNEAMGLNGAFNTLRNLVNDGRIILSDCVPSNKTYVQGQVDYVLIKTGLKRLKMFMPELMRNQTTFTPKDIMNIVLKVAILKNTTFDKTIANR